VRAHESDFGEVRQLVLQNLRHGDIAYGILWIVAIPAHAALAERLFVATKVVRARSG
jgi:hypothetical protein